MTKTHTKNNPLTDAALAELDRLAVSASRGGLASLVDQETYRSELARAYPALRKRLLAAESRLAEVERERDELRAKNAAKEDLILEWARYVHTPTGERDTTVAERFWKDIEARFFGGEFDSLRWLTDRDAQQRREGAADELERLASSDLELREMFLTESQMRLRAFSHAKLADELRKAAKRLREVK